MTVTERLISMTLAGGLACLLILIFKRLLTRRPETLYYACLAALILFAVPFRPAWSPDFSQIDVRPNITAALKSPTSDRQNAPTAGNVSPEEQDAAAPQRTGPFPSDEFHLRDILTSLSLSIVWLTVAALIFLRYIISYLIFRRKILKDAVQNERIGKVSVVEGSAPSPMLVGFFRPVIVMPKTGLPSGDRELAICHELAHWRRGDPWIKLLAAAVNSLHWFNPLSYVLVRTLDEACEYACDSRVVRDGGSRTGYGNMLLNMACQSTPILTENMSRSKKQLKRRLELIMKFSKKNVFINVLSILLILTLAAGSTALAAGAAPILSSMLGLSGTSDEQRTVGILEEYLSGDYDDDTVVTRAEAAALMVRLKGLEPTFATGTIFSDVPADYWAAESIETAYQCDIVDGCGDGAFYPDDPLTFEQAEKMIECTLGYSPAARAKGGWPEGYMRIAADHGLTSSVTGNVGETVTRRTLAKMVYNVLDVPFLVQTVWGPGGLQEYAPSDHLTIRYLLDNE